MGGGRTEGVGYEQTKEQDVRSSQNPPSLTDVLRGVHGRGALNELHGQPPPRANVMADRSGGPPSCRPERLGDDLREELVERLLQVLPDGVALSFCR